MTPTSTLTNAQAGPAVRQLQQALLTRGYITTSAVFEGTTEPVSANLVIYNSGNFVRVTLPRTIDYPAQTQQNICEAFGSLALALPGYSLNVARISTSAGSDPALERLIVAAWCETFHVEPPTADVRMRLLEEHRAQMLDHLRGGQEGIARWNANIAVENRARSNYAGSDLAGADLQGVVLRHLNWERSSFERCDLKGASLHHGEFGGAKVTGANLEQVQAPGCRFKGADFTGATLVGANLGRADLRDACLHADLSKANLEFAILSGADLSQANLEGAYFRSTLYDENTKFPTGMRLPRSLRFDGLPLPVGDSEQEKGYAEFLKRLKEATARTRLRTVFSMLRRKSFDLFHEVDENGLRGIVRSHRDRSPVYSCYLTPSGKYGCLATSSRPCGGLYGAPCKHLLVLIISLVKTGRADGRLAADWLEATRKKKPVHDKDRMCDVFLKYKGAQAGEIDWRPTETIPEDYHAL